MSNNNTNGQRPSLWRRIKSLLPSDPGDRHQLLSVLRKYESKNLIDRDSLTMIEGALQISEMTVRDIMVPRVQMVTVKNNTDPEDILMTSIESGYSRFPVIGNDADDVIGILIAKDLLNYFADQGNNKFDIKDMMRKVFYVPESKRLNILLREFRVNRSHMTIVVDEYSGIAGLVTMEDIIEEVIGDIEDEHDIDSEDYIRSHGRNRYTINALTPISEFNDFFDMELSDSEYDTVGGLTLKAFGYMPKRGEDIEFEGLNIKVLRADKRRIHLIRVSRDKNTQSRSVESSE